MGRRSRILLAGGIYHVYNRVSRGEHVFRDEGEAASRLVSRAASRRVEDQNFRAKIQRVDSDIAGADRTGDEP